MTSTSSSKPTPAERNAPLPKAWITGEYYLMFTLLGLSIASFGPSLPFLAEHTGSRLGEISFLFVARQLGFLLGAYLVGRLYDQKRGHRVLASGVLLMAATLALVPSISLLAVLTVVLFCLGFSESFLDVGGNTLLVWLQRERSGPFMNGLHLFYGVGAFIAPALVAQSVLISQDIRLAYWAVALIAVPTSLALLRAPSPAHPGAVDPASVRPPQGWLLGLLVAFFFLFGGAESGFGGWI
ncbi:MAG TPA: MFS transporter, partial [Anaerolineaceae bacterium]|nr:MFS transporter [Anaerolineaceae bacterium]